MLIIEDLINSTRMQIRKAIEEKDSKCNRNRLVNGFGDHRSAGCAHDEGLVGELEAIGVDACGENGEFHTFVYDGPLFKHRVDFTTGPIFHIENHAVLPIIARSEPEDAT